MPGANVVATAWVEILPEMDGIRSKISEELGAPLESESKSAGKKSGDSFSSAFKGAIGVIGTALAAVGLSELTQQAAESSMVMSRLSASAEQNSVSAEAMNSTYSNLIGVLGDTDRSVETAGNAFALCGDNQAALEQLTTSLTGAYSQFGDGLPVEGLAEAANETAKVGTVTGSFADALNWVNASTEQWNAALSGNPAAMAAFNAAVDQGMSKEDAFNAALAACTTEQERQQLVLSTLNGLYGEAGQKYMEANADLIAFNQSQDALSTSMTELGKALMPVQTLLNNLAAGAIGALAPAFQAIGGAVTSACAAFAPLGTAVQLAATPAQALSTAMQGIPTILQNLVTSSATFVQTALPQMTTGLMTMLSTLAAQLPMFLQQVIPTVLGGVTSMLTTVIQQVPTILMGLIDLVVTGLTSFVSSIGAALPTVLPPLLNAAISAIANLVTQVVNNIPTYIPMIVQAAISLFNGIVDSIPQVLPNVVSALGDLLTTVINNIPTYISTIISAAVQLFVAIAEAVPQVVTDVLMAVGDLLNQVFNAISSFDLGAAGKALIDGFIGGIGSMAGAVVDAVTGVVGGAIEAAKNFLGIHSPSRVFREIGDFAMQGLSVGIEKATKGVVRTVEGAMSDVAGVGLTVPIGTTDLQAAVSPSRVGASPTFARDAQGQWQGGIGQLVQNFNQPVQTPAEYARFWRMQQTYGLAAEKG